MAPTAGTSSDKALGFDGDEEAGIAGVAFALRVCLSWDSDDVLRKGLGMCPQSRVTLSYPRRRMVSKPTRRHWSVSGSAQGNVRAQRGAAGDTAGASP